MPAEPDRNLASQISAKAALAGGVLCLLALLLLGLAVSLLPAVRAHDILALRDFAQLATPGARPWENAVAGIVDTIPGLLLGGVVLATAIARRRPRLALLVAVIMFGACESTELVKALLSVPRHSPLLAPQQVSTHSFPSGHSTAIMAIALCAVLVAPPRWRTRVAALGALLTLAVSFALLPLKWHFPTDVLGGYLMAGAWAGFGVAALRAADARWPLARSSSEHAHLRRAPLARAPLARRIAPLLARAAAALAVLKSATGLLAVLAASALFAFVLVSRPGGAIDFATSHPQLIAAAGAIAALALAISSAAAAALRR